jgi:very-short-patch-repair endonuclease
MPQATFTPPTSFMEDRFLSFFSRYAPDLSLERQFSIGPYYVDFMNKASGVVIEIDGEAFHTSPEQKARDSMRQAYIEAQGYVVVRFSGKAVYHTPVQCAYSARGKIQRILSGGKQFKENSPQTNENTHEMAQEI